MNKNDFAKTPPMGWNSWDCYGASVTEKELKQNADYMAEHLKKYAGSISSAIFSGMNRQRIPVIIINLRIYVWMNMED